VGLDLREQQVGLLLDAGDNIRTGDEAQRGLVHRGDGDQGGAELGGVAGLQTVHAFPAGDGLLGALGVVLDDQFRPDRGGAGDEQFAAEEAGLNDGGGDAVGLHVVLQRLHPAFKGELGRGVGCGELPADNARRGGDGDHVTGALRAHDREDRAGHIQRAEEVGLHLLAQLVLAGHFKEAGIEVTGVVDEHINAAEARDGDLGGGDGCCRVGDIEGQGEEVLVLAECLGDLRGVAGGGDDGVAGGEGRLGHVDAHAAGGAGDEPDVVAHGDTFRTKTLPACAAADVVESTAIRRVERGPTVRFPIRAPLRPARRRIFVFMDDTANDISAFLTSRRAKLSPEQAGIPDFGGRRRVPGLRREEVALIAGMSAEYYKRLERGNASGVSEAVLDGISRALQLDEAERAHLYELVRTANASAHPQRRRQVRKTQLSAGMQQTIDAMSTVPVFIQNGRLDAVATNPLGRALFATMLDDVRPPANAARFVFLDPRSQDFYTDWEGNARQIVAILRAEAGRSPYDRQLSDLVGELSTRSDLFRKLWGAHDVREHRTGTKSINHPVVGRLDLTFQGMDLSSDRGLQMLVFSAEPGSPTYDGLQLLANWAYTNRAGLTPVTSDATEV
jgi:transcriptional regulator with XRE-family HTH domain